MNRALGGGGSLWSFFFFFFFGHTTRHAGSSLTRDRTCAPCSGSAGVLTTGLPGRSAFDLLNSSGIRPPPYEQTGMTEGNWGPNILSSVQSLHPMSRSWVHFPGISPLQHGSLRGVRSAGSLPLRGRYCSPWWKLGGATCSWPHPARGMTSVVLSWAGRSWPQLKCHRLLTWLPIYSRFSWINVSSFAAYP